MTEEELPPEAEEASLRLNQALKSCRSMVSTYREMIERAVGESSVEEMPMASPPAGEP